MDSRALTYTLIYISLLIVFYYIFIVLPGKKRRREHEEMQKAVRAGDRIITIGGISGTVAEASEQTLVIESGTSGSAPFSRSGRRALIISEECYFSHCPVKNSAVSKRGAALSERSPLCLIYFAFC